MSLITVWEQIRTVANSGSFREKSLLRLRELLIICALTAGMYFLSRFVWILMPLSEPQIAVDVAPSLAHPAALQPPPPAPTRVSDIGGWHLFGNPSPPPEAPKEEKPEPEPEIDFKGIQLRGIILNPRNPEDARASIAVNGDAEWLSINDQLQGKAALLVRDIQRDHVVLSQGELQKTLQLFPRNNAEKDSAAEDNAKLIDLRENKRASAVATKYRKRLASQPDAVKQLLHINTVREGEQIIGYRIRAKRNRSDFAALGLKSSDVIRSVNGIQLDNLISLQTAREALQNAEEVRLGITRQNKPIELVVRP